MISNAEQRKRRGIRSSIDRGGELWRVRVIVVADETMMWHYENEEHVLAVYIRTLMAEVAAMFRYEMTCLSLKR